MNKTSKEILDFLSSTGKSASEMTHALKFIGNGSMEDGLLRIGDYFEREVKIGTAKGAIGATIILTTVALVKKKIDESKKHKEEGEAILKGLEEGLIDHSEEDNVLSDHRQSNDEEQ
ncbi:putative uncharacterized protein [Clostridium sp. CAG:221]|uniref:hypothetical protein n=1 Tax=Clostridium sp. CAG:221 TaxID=1262780 RepID=UPI00034016FF|nr:hypothetical protein [Clostridium sp. CAG:221]CDB15314.1 putative uncharacterized protein [Clostridium sp. CAG:221]